MGEFWHTHRQKITHIKKDYCSITSLKYKLIIYEPIKLGSLCFFQSNLELFFSCFSLCIGHCVITIPSKITHYFFLIILFFALLAGFMSLWFWRVISFLFMLLHISSPKQNLKASFLQWSHLRF